MSATEWFLEATTRPEEADKRFIFRIDNGEVLSDLKIIGVASDKSVEDKKKEHELFGADGFEKMTDRVAQLEQQMGIQDLNQFTPR